MRWCSLLQMLFFSLLDLNILFLNLIIGYHTYNFLCTMGRYKIVPCEATHHRYYSVLLIIDFRNIACNSDIIGVNGVTHETYKALNNKTKCEFNSVIP